MPPLNYGVSITLLSSATSVQGTPNRAVCSETKATTRGFGRTWANKLNARRIRVNV
jgi:NAD(P)-dependent dehydrogenase (short-subunit alcohol dehydrogenase family)